MGHVTRETTRCTIDIDTSAPRVLFRQRWRYNWLMAPGQPAWTGREREHFHRRADLMVWDVWSNRASFRVSGGAEFARRHARKLIAVNFDILWTLSNPHWTVDVTKVPPGFMSHPTRVEWNQRRIYLCTEDFETTRHSGGIIAHEFGHSMGIPAYLVVATNTARRRLITATPQASSMSAARFEPGISAR